MLRTLLISLTLMASTAWAGNIQKGQPLPPLEVAQKGELVLNAKGDIQYQPWSSQAIDAAPRVQILQYMAARPSAETQIRPFTNRLEAEAFPQELHQVTTVVNLSDVTFGASGWALSELQKNKHIHPESTLVADWNGKGLQTWQLTQKSSALVVLDDKGSVLFFKDGALSASEVDQVINLIRQEVQKRKAGNPAEVVDSH